MSTPYENSSQELFLDQIPTETEMEKILRTTRNQPWHLASYEVKLVSTNDLEKEHTKKRRREMVEEGDEKPQKKNERKDSLRNAKFHVETVADPEHPFGPPKRSFNTLFKNIGKMHVQVPEEQEFRTSMCASSDILLYAMAQEIAKDQSGYTIDLIDPLHLSTTLNPLKRRTNKPVVTFLPANMGPNSIHWFLSMCIQNGGQAVHLIFDSAFKSINNWHRVANSVMNQLQGRTDLHPILVPLKNYQNDSWSCGFWVIYFT